MQLDSDESFDISRAIKKDKLNKVVIGQHSLENTGSFHFYENEPHESYIVGATVLLILDAFRAISAAIFKSTIFFLIERLEYDELPSIIYYHLVGTITWISPCLSMIVADRYVGKFLMIIIGAVIGSVGYCLLSSAASVKEIYDAKLMFWFGIILRCIGRGTIMSCYLIFGEEQLLRTDVNRYTTQFYRLSYVVFSGFFILAVIIMPIVRSEIYCQEKYECFEGVYITGAVCQITFLLLFIIAKPFYNIRHIEGSLIVGVLNCMRYAYLKRKMVQQDPDYMPQGHWLDYATDKYGDNFIKDLKSVVRVLRVISVPAVLVYCIYVQHESIWVFQATRMNCKVGNYFIKPEQMLSINVISTIIFVPATYYILFPILKILYIGKPLARIGEGIILIIIAYMLAFSVEYKIKKAFDYHIKEGKGQIRIFNGINCDYILENLTSGPVILKAMDFVEDKDINVIGKYTSKLKAIPVIKSGSECSGMNIVENIPIQVVEKSAMSYFFTGDAEIFGYEEVMRKSLNGYPYVRILSKLGNNYKIEFRHKTRELFYELHYNKVFILIPNIYDIYITDNLFKNDVELKMGGSYVFTLSAKTKLRQNMTDNFSMGVNVYIPPNSVHIMQQIPQIMCLSLGEIFFSTSILELTHAESPPTMKSVMWASSFILRGLGHFLFAVTCKFYFNFTIQCFLYIVILFFAFCFYSYSISKYIYSNPNYFTIH